MADRDRNKYLHPMTALLQEYGLNGAKLGRILGVSQPTGRGRLDDPTQLTIGDLAKLRRYGIPAERLKGAIL